MKRTLILSLLASALFILPIAQQVQAADEVPVLDKGIYGTIGFGAGLAALAAITEGSATKNLMYELGGAGQSFLSVSGGFLWKRTETVGWNSYLQFSYRPVSFSNQGDEYTQNIFSVDFLQTYGYWSGWNPFVGFSWALYDLEFTGAAGRGIGTGGVSGSDNQFGFVGGWDLMGTPASNWIFRTTFRWYPKIEITHSNQETVTFPNFEIQPIEVIYRF